MWCAKSSSFDKSSDIEESRLMTNVDGYDVNVSMDVLSRDKVW